MSRSPVLILLFFLVVITGILISGIFKAYKKCPPGHVLIIFNNKPDSFGNMTKFVFSGGAFVWPFISSSQLLSLAPIQLNLILKELLTSDIKRTNIEMDCMFGISTSETVLQNAVNRLSGLNNEQIKEIASNILAGQLRKVISEMEMEEIKKGNGLNNNFKKEAEGELLEIGLKIISIDLKTIEEGY